MTETQLNLFSKILTAVLSAFIAYPDDVIIIKQPMQGLHVLSNMGQNIHIKN